MKEEIERVTTIHLTSKDGLFYLKDIPTYLRAGELQYFRIRKELWARSLDRLAEAGFHAVSTYIPWIWHEPQEGRLDFTGETHPQRDLITFIQTCQDRGFGLMVRPGPYIYAEYRGFGHPLWLGKQYPLTVVRDASGMPQDGGYYHNYSLLHPTYLAKVEDWYRDVVATIRPYFHCPIISFQLDNETSLMYTNSLGRLDFNPDTVQRYRTYLQQKYGTIAALNSTWDTKRHPHFDTIFPPTPPFHHGELVDWQAFLEEWIATYLRYLRRLALEQGVSVPLAINEQAAFLSPADPTKKAPISDLYGFDIYTKVTEYKHISDFPFGGSQYTVTFQQYATPERPLLCLELGAGWWDHRAVVDNEATLQLMFSSLAHGLKGHVLYVVQDGFDPEGTHYHFQTILDEHAQPLPRYEIVQKVHHFISTYEQDLLHSMEIQDSIAFLNYPPYTRFMAEEFVGGNMYPNPIRYLAFWGFFGLYNVMLTAGYNPRIFDLQMLSSEELSRYTAAVLPTKGFLDRQSFAKLEHYVRNGGHLVTLPVPITTDEYKKPLDSASLYPQPATGGNWVGSLPLINHLLVNWIVKYNLFVRHRSIRELPTAMHLSDLYEPALVAQQAILPSVRLKAGKMRLRGDYRVTHFAEGAAEQLLHDGKKLAGYRAHVGQGTSVMVGTLAGGSYWTSSYYRLKPEERQELRLFIQELLTQAGVKRRQESALDLEIVTRRTPSGWFLFFMNRVGRQHGTIRLLPVDENGLPPSCQIQPIFSYKGSQATKQGDYLFVSMAADDVLVLRCW